MHRSVPLCAGQSGQNARNWCQTKFAGFFWLPSRGVPTFQPRCGYILVAMKCTLTYDGRLAEKEAIVREIMSAEVL
jgi:hypothetical protein